MDKFPKMSKKDSPKFQKAFKTCPFGMMLKLSGLKRNCYHCLNYADEWSGRCFSKLSIKLVYQRKNSRW